MNTATLEEVQALGFDSIKAAEAHGLWLQERPSTEFAGWLQSVTATSTRKASKVATLTAMDHFFWTLRDFQGGTREEQERGAKACYARLQEQAALVATLAANPSKPVLDSAWLRERTTVDVPTRLTAFAVRWEAWLSATTQENRK